MVVWCFCTYKYKWQLSPGAHTPHTLTRCSRGKQLPKEPMQIACHLATRLHEGKSNRKDFEPLSCCVWETMIWSTRSSLRWSCAWWEVVLVRTCPGCAAQLGEGNPQPAWAASIDRHTNTALRTFPDTPVSAPTKPGLTANTRWSCTAPKRLPRHVNVHTPSRELGFCVQ